VARLSGELGESRIGGLRDQKAPHLWATSLSLQFKVICGAWSG